MTGAYLILTDIFFKLGAIPSITSSVASTEPTPTCVHDHTITTILLHGLGSTGYGQIYTPDFANAVFATRSRNNCSVITQKCRVASTSSRSVATDVRTVCGLTAVNICNHCMGKAVGLMVI
jgi:hypothetical protein